MVLIDVTCVFRVYWNKRVYFLNKIVYNGIVNGFYSNDNVKRML